MSKAKLKVWVVALFFAVGLGFFQVAPRLAYGSAQQAREGLEASTQINSNITAAPGSEGAEASLQSPEPVEPGEARFGVYDRNTPNITLDFPLGAVLEAVEVKAYYDSLPANVSPPPGGIVGSPFYLGIWVNGEGRTVERFHQSIVIHAKYEGNSPEGEQVHLSMYDPTTQEWLKLCSRSDPYGQVVSGALLLPTPLEAGGNILLAITTDPMPPLEQSINSQGNTILSVPGNNARLNVAAGAVAVGTFFEVTGLSKALSANGVQLLPTPVDIKACQVGQDNIIRQVTQISRPLIVEFDYDAATAGRAGGKDNITIVQLQNQRWITMEELGTRVGRGDTTITVETSRLGPFGMVIR